MEEPLEPSDKRMVASALLVIAGVFPLFFILFGASSFPIVPGWLVACILVSSFPLIGAGLLNPFKRAHWGAAFGFLIEALIVLYAIFTYAPVCG
jgi:hypothetical protein